MTNPILLQHNFWPDDLQCQIGSLFEHDNNHRYHESIGNLMHADVYFGRAVQVLNQKEEIEPKNKPSLHLRYQAV